MNLPLNQIQVGDCMELIKLLPDKCVHSCVTSPPYYALRDYGIEPSAFPEVTYTIFGFPVTVPAMTCQLGHEKDPKEFVGHIVHIFREVKRVLRDDGSLWLNFGDSYASTSKDRTVAQAKAKSTLKGGLDTQVQSRRQQNKITSGLKPKDMIGIPWMVAFALRDDGWYLRMDNIWYKRNPMPESVYDRPTKAHEYIFLLSKSERYFYDAEAVKTESKWNPDDQKMPDGWDTGDGAHGGCHRNGREKGKTINRDKQRGHSRRHAGFNDRWDHMTHQEQASMGANRRSVWDIPTQGFKGAHFATFPEDLVVIPIKAGTSAHGCCSECGAPWRRVLSRQLVPGHGAVKKAVVDQRDIDSDEQDQGSNRQRDGHKNGHIYQSETLGWEASCSCAASIVPCVVLDIFSGAGTTAMVARKLGRDYVAFEIKPANVKLSDDRIYKEVGMFK